MTQPAFVRLKSCSNCKAQVWAPLAVWAASNVQPDYEVRARCPLCGWFNEVEGFFKAEPS